MTVGATATKDTKCASLLFLINVAMLLSRLKKACPTISHSKTAKSLRSVTDSMCTVEKEAEDLALKLMVTWGIDHSTLLKWIDLEPNDFVRNMTSIGSTVSHLSNLQAGRTRKSQRR